MRSTLEESVIKLIGRTFVFNTTEYLHAKGKSTFNIRVIYCFRHLFTKRVQLLWSYRSRVSKPFSVGGNASRALYFLVCGFCGAPQIPADYLSIAVVFRLSFSIHMHSVDGGPITHIRVLTHTIGVIRTVTLVWASFHHSGGRKNEKCGQGCNQHEIGGKSTIDETLRSLNIESLSHLFGLRIAFYIYFRIYHDR